MVVLLGLYRGYMGDNGKENGNYYNGLDGWLSKSWCLFASLLYYGTYYLGYPKRDHNHDNHLHAGELRGAVCWRESLP